MHRQPARLFTMARRVAPVRRSTTEKPATTNSLAPTLTPSSENLLATQTNAYTQTQTQPAGLAAVAPGTTLNDSPIYVLHALQDAGTIDWSDSFHGLGQAPFPREVSDILLAPLEPADIEIKPDGILYLPEIKYRRILNRAFGPGGWGLAPRTLSHITPKQVSREYALICSGRLVSVARGEQDYFGGEEKLTTALEGCKSNALMRCCKDLGIASELWDPAFIRKFKKTYCDELFAEHVVNKKKKKLWKLKVNSLDYPYKAC